VEKRSKRKARRCERRHGGLNATSAMLGKDTEIQFLSLRRNHPREEKRGEDLGEGKELEGKSPLP